MDLTGPDDASSATTTTTMTVPTPSSSSELAHSASTPSLPSLSVRFAPLPELAPRKRRSNTPLGMAARGQLVNRRRQQSDGLPHHFNNGNNGWTPQELEEQRRRYEIIAARNAYAVASINAREVEEERAHAFHDDDEATDDEGQSSNGHSHNNTHPSATSTNSNSRRRSDDRHSPSTNSSSRRSRRTAHKRTSDGNGEYGSADDPLGTLGRFVKGAGKTLWRRVASKDLTQAKNKYVAEREQDQFHRSRRRSDPGPPLSDGAPSEKIPPPPMPKPILTSIITNPLTNSYPSQPSPYPTESPSSSATPPLPPPSDLDPEKVEEVEEEEGRVWEEEIGETFPLNVGQTDTFIEGRPIYSKASSDSRPSSPTAAAPPEATITTTKVSSGQHSPPSPDTPTKTKLLSLPLTRTPSLIKSAPFLSSIKSKKP